MSKNPDSTVQAHASLMDAFEHRDHLTDEIRILKQTLSELRAFKHRADSKSLDLRDMAMGLKSPYFADRAAAVDAGLVSVAHEAEQAEAEIQAGTDRLQRLESDLSALSFIVSPEVRQHHQHLIGAAQDRLSDLTATHERLSQLPVAEPPAALIRRHQDLLASHALGEDVASQLAEVTAQLQSAEAGASEEQARTGAALMGLARRIEEAKTDLSRLQSRLQAMTAAQLREALEEAVNGYLDMAAQTADALGRVWALSSLHAKAEPRTNLGLNLERLGSSWLPDIRTGRPRLDVNILTERRNGQIAHTKAIMELS